MMFPNLFSPLKIGSVDVKNRKSGGRKAFCISCTGICQLPALRGIDIFYGNSDDSSRRSSHLRSH